MLTTMLRRGVSNSVRRKVIERVKSPQPEGLEGEMDDSLPRMLADL